MIVNDDIADIEQPDRICSLTFVVNEFPRLFVHPSIFSTKDTMKAYYCYCHTLL